MSDKAADMSELRDAIRADLRAKGIQFVTEHDGSEWISLESFAEYLRKELDPTYDGLLLRR